MNVTLAMQDVLATIQRNQQQIDLLTANNTQLVQFLLSQGMVQNMAEMSGFNAAASGAAADSPAVVPLLPAPAQRRGRPRVEESAAEAAAQPATTGQGNLLIAFARQCGGKLKLADFRAAHRGKTPGISNSFFETTMYSKVSSLTQAGLLTKIGLGEYRLNDKR